MKTFKKFLVGILVIITCISVYACKTEPDKDIKVVFTNDIHCGLKDNIDISSLFKYYNDIDRTKNYTFLVDTGDFSQGASIGTFSKGEDMYELMDEVGYDVLTLGNHEFDYSIPILLKNSIHLTGKMVCSNFYDLKKNEPVFDPYKILDAGSKEIAFIVVTTPDTIKSTSPTYFEDKDGKDVLAAETGTKLQSFGILTIDKNV